MSQVISYTGNMSKGNHHPPQDREEIMGSAYRRGQGDTGETARETWEALRGLTRQAAMGTSDRQALVALELYLQIPTFRRQGRRLSCR